MAKNIIAKLVITERAGERYLTGTVLQSPEPGVKLTLRKIGDDAYHLFAEKPRRARGAYDPASINSFCVLPEDAPQ